MVADFWILFYTQESFPEPQSHNFRGPGHKAAAFISPASWINGLPLSAWASEITLSQERSVHLFTTRKGNQRRRHSREAFVVNGNFEEAASDVEFTGAAGVSMWLFDSAG